MKRRFILIAALSVTPFFFSCDPIDKEDEEKPEEVVEVKVRENAPNRGFYKDVFMDGGVWLTSRTTLPAATYLGWKFEYYASGSDNEDVVNTNLQKRIYVGNDDDLNGVLLYPDGAPRFRVIYVNGGKSTKHGASLGTEGRNRLIQFNENGGGYVGTCAGAFFASRGYDSYDVVDEYLGIWPGHTRHTGLSDSESGMFVASGSMLLNYYDFGGDNYIASVRHNGGCYAESLPAGTDVLARYDKESKTKMHRQPSIWTYKVAANPLKGRVVMCGSHPESITEGERRDLMAAMLRLASDGCGITRVKTVLKKGESWDMTKSTSDNDPDHTRIGDLQYHHFAVGIPSTAKNVSVSISSSSSCDLHLFMKKDNFAYSDVADYKDISSGSEKELFFDKIEGGVWYIAVKCATQVTSTVVKNVGEYVQYSGRTEVLNGVPYTIKVNWR